MRYRLYRCDNCETVKAIDPYASWREWGCGAVIAVDAGFARCPGTLQELQARNIEGVPTIVER